MGAVGYKGPNWLDVNNPYVPDPNAAGGESDYVAMTYEKFVSSAKHTHLRDYFNIRIRPDSGLTETGRRSPDLASTDETVGSPEPGSVVLPDTSPRPVDGLSAIVQELEYPPEPGLNGFHGLLVVRVLVEKNGEVSGAQVSQSSGHPSLDQAAIAAARAVKWRPGIENGKAVRAWAEVPMNLAIRQ